MSGSSYPESPAYYDALLKDVAQANADMTTVQSGLDGWKTFGAMLRSVLRGSGETDEYATSNPLMPDSLGTLVQNHLSGWTGSAADEFVKQVNLVASFGSDVGMTMYDELGENPPGAEFPASNTFHRALSDLQDALNLIRDQQPKIDKAYNGWAQALTNNICNYSNGLFGATNLCANMPDWANTTYSVVYNPTSTDYDGSSSGNEVFTIHDGVEPTPLVLTLPGIASAESGDIVDSVNATDVKNQITAHFTTLYKQRMGPLADLITSADGTYVQVGKNLPTKVDDSYLPKGKSKTSGQNGNNGSGGMFNGGGFGGGSGGFNGGLPGGSSGGSGGGFGTGGGGLPGGGSGGSGGGFGTGGGGLPGGTGGAGGGFGGGGGLPGGGSGGFGGGGLPGGSGGSGGGGGLPFGSGGGGGTKLAGVGGLPGGGGFGGGGGGLGNLGPIGGAGSGGGAGGFGAGLSGAGGGAGDLGGVGAAGAESAAAGSSMPMMPPMMPPMAGAGQNDNTRQRKSWLPDDDDIWGDSDAVVPPVISSDG
jgi:hypothetical protein